MKNSTVALFMLSGAFFGAAGAHLEVAFRPLPAPPECVEVTTVHAVPTAYKRKPQEPRYGN